MMVVAAITIGGWKLWAVITGSATLIGFGAGLPKLLRRRRARTQKLTLTYETNGKDEDTESLLDALRLLLAGRDDEDGPTKANAS